MSIVPGKNLKVRRKSEQKRQHILDIAETLFRQAGYEGTSMSAIAARLGGSKATLYNYFSGKEDIFVEVILNVAHQLAGDAAPVSSGDKPLREKLFDKGLRFLTVVTSERIISLRRLVITETHRMNIGREVYNRAVRSGWQQVAAFIEEAMEKGEVAKADPWLAAMHFKGLLESDLVDKCLLGIDRDISPARLRERVEIACDIFIAYYGRQS